MRDNPAEAEEAFKNFYSPYKERLGNTKRHAELCYKMAMEEKKKFQSLRSSIGRASAF
jgi:hypothetical protein